MPTTPKTQRYQNRNWVRLVVLTLVWLSYACPPIRSERPRPSKNPTDLEIYFLTKQVAYGRTPIGKAEFEQLHKQGFRVIISVDRVPPEAEIASQFQMDYRHLPIGYGPIKVTRAMDFAKSTSSASGKVYFHCHRGQHRAPTAAVVASVGDGSLSVSRIKEILDRTDLAHTYTDLYASAINATPFSQKTLINHLVRTEPLQSPTATLKFMLEIARPAERLLALREQTPNALTQSKEKLLRDAQLLRDSLGELSRFNHAPTTNFKKKASQSFSIANEIQLHLLKLQTEEPDAKMLTKLREHLKALESSCIECHTEHRK